MNNALLVSRIDPDIIIGTETWLSFVHSCSEILIAGSYQIERRDRASDPHGGVLIAYKKDLAVTREYDLETDCKILWCSLQLAGCKTIHLGAYYRPHEYDEQFLLELERLLSFINDHRHILLGGDFNLPGWDWRNHMVKKCNQPGLHYQFGDILDDKSLVQLVDEPTRQQNTLDLAITNQPTTIKDVSIVSGVSDHDCPFITLDLTPVRHKQSPRKIPLYRRAKWDSLADDLSKDIVALTANMENLSTNELWEGLKAAINKGIDRHIPHKVCKSKDNLPWITPRIRKLIKKRDRLSIKRKGLVRSKLLI